MKTQIVKKENQLTSNWTGGTTTELFIYPENTSFLNRDFDFRISSATIEVEESTFTIFNNLNRILMILEGQLEINHIDRYSKTLNKLDIDEFHGEWPTTAKGKVTDFNLIFNDKMEGNIDSLKLPQNAEIGITNEFKYNYKAIYLLEGHLLINNTSEIFPKDFVIISELISQEEATIKALQNSLIVEVNVKYKL
ncbi:MAG: HutD family protein [Flavobacteriia bacterium]|nr:HutD family protein [Flavobacteriia bacterium]